jgi:hypothetical protein
MWFSRPCLSISLTLAMSAFVVTVEAEDVDDEESTLRMC